MSIHWLMTDWNICRQMRLSLVFTLIVLIGFSVTVTSGDLFDRVMTRLRMSSASTIRRLIQNQRIQPWMLVPFFNWRVNKINGILEITTRCLNTPFCHRLVQSVDLLNYDRKWYTRFMGYKNFIIVWKLVLRWRRYVSHHYHSSVFRSLLLLIFECFFRCFAQFMFNQILPRIIEASQPLR